MLLVPSVWTIKVSLSAPVCVGANVMMIVHVAPGWIIGRKLCGRHVPEALKSGELVVITVGNAIGPSPVFVMVMGEDCADRPIATVFGKFTVADAGEGVPGGALSVCKIERFGCVDADGLPSGPVVSKNAISNGVITYPVTASLK